MSSARSRGRIVVAGSLAQRPGVGGHAWVFLQYLLGFQRLGFEVLFLDWLDPIMCRDRAGASCVPADSWNLDWIRAVMRNHGLADAWSLTVRGIDQHFGLHRKAVREWAREADVLLNVMGFLDDPELLALPRLRVFLDIDPGFGQMWQELGLARPFHSHDFYFTIGENIGSAACIVPTCGIAWKTTPQPVVLDHWPVVAPPRDAVFTSIASWRGPFGPIEYHGQTYGLRVHEFRKFASLPNRVRERFTLALDIAADETQDLAMLSANDWSLVDPRVVANTPEAVRQFIHNSKAELIIAKHLYVATRGGWFSDRSICYLASGRPVLAQDTGFTGRYPVGEGLLAFRSLEEAATGVEAIAANYARHSRCAREIAEEHFGSAKVLSRLLENLA